MYEMSMLACLDTGHYSSYLACFSPACCNLSLQWDQAYAVPKEVRSMSLFTGDILALAATDKAVFTAGADGSLRRWALGKLGELSEAEVRDKAHDGRITALAVSGSLLFSAGYDGDIKVSACLMLMLGLPGADAGEGVSCGACVQLVV